MSLELDDTPPSDNHFNERYQVLALSGGGYRGLFTAGLLVEFEKAHGPVRERFNLIAGTSIGSILAGALALGVPASDCAEGMLEHGQTIFPPTRWWNGWSRKAGQLFAATYSTEPLALAARQIVGDAVDTKLSKISTPLAIPCVSHTRARTNIFRSKGLAGSDADSVTVLDAMLASAAAPTYFPSKKILTENMIDGGVTVNAPELIAVADAIKYQRIPVEALHVLSLGTAGVSLARPGEDETSTGVLGWMGTRKLFQTCMEAQETLVVEQCEAILRGRYLRFDATPSVEQAKVLGLDSAGPAATETLLSLAKNCWKTSVEGQPVAIGEFGSHTVE